MDELTRLREEEKRVAMLRDIRAMLDKVDPNKLRLADLWHMKRVLEVAEKGSESSWKGVGAARKESLAYRELEILLIKLESAGYQCSFSTDLPGRLMVLNVVAEEEDMVYLGKLVGVVKEALG